MTAYAGLPKTGMRLSNNMLRFTRPKQMNSKPASMLVLSLFVIIGLSMGVYSYNHIADTRAFLSIAEPTSATVTKINEKREVDDEDGSIDYQYQPVFSYQYNGETYETVSKMSSSKQKYHVGEQLNVLVNPNFAAEARIDSFSEVYGGFVIGLLISVSFFFSGLIPLLIRLKKKKSHNWLKAHGRKIEGHVTRIFENHRENVNSMHHFVIYVKAHDPTTGQQREFASVQLLQDPKEHLSVGDKLSVYVNPSDKDEYVVDVK